MQCITDHRRRLATIAAELVSRSSTTTLGRHVTAVSLVSSIYLFFGNATTPLVSVINKLNVSSITHAHLVHSVLHRTPSIGLQSLPHQLLIHVESTRSAVGVTPPSDANTQPTRHKTPIRLLLSPPFCHKTLAISPKCENRQSRRVAAKLDASCVRRAAARWGDVVGRATGNNSSSWAKQRQVLFGSAFRRR